MPHWRTRSNLSAAQFPFATPWMGRSVIVNTFDQNQDSSVSLTDTYKDKGQPQVFYMHNCLPTSQGFQSVGYDSKIPASAFAGTAFDKAFILRNTAEDRFLYSPGVNGNNVANSLFDAAIGHWRPFPSASAVPNPLITTAYINNQTYIFIEGTGCFVYNKAVPAFVPVALAGLVVAEIIGITAANGYMIAWTITRVFHSSAVSPVDFIPSLQTGAGYADVNDIKGPIQFCLQISGGFVVYTERNAVGATFTGNIRFPFAFKEVTNSGGVHSFEDVVSDSTSAEHYAITSSGLQKIDRLNATGVYPELTDFLTSNIFEDFDEVAVTFSTQYLNVPVIHKLSLCANRYLVVSYGKVSLTHCLVYDLVMRRWGKLKIDHVDCFDYFTSARSVAGSELVSVKGSVGFLQIDGTVRTVNFASGFAASSGVLVIGKFQFTRNSLIQLLGFNWESVNPAGAFAAYVLPSIDGTNFLPAVVPHLFLDAGRLKEYLCRVAGVNISLAIVGSFNVVSNEIEFLKDGSR